MNILPILQPFAILFSTPSWKKVLTLSIGAILCTGKRTVCAALRIMGLAMDPNFSKYHHILNRVNWDLLLGSKILLKLLLSLSYRLNGQCVLFIDETLERRKGVKIKAKGYYRDAVRSSRSTVVKTTGLKWIVTAFACKFPFAKRIFALPFLTVLEPSLRSDQERKKKHKTTLQWTRQIIMQIVRWFPSIPFTVVGDGGFASANFALTCFKHGVTLVSRLKINARLYDFPPIDNGEKRGRKPMKGIRLNGFKWMLENVSRFSWKETEVIGYSGKKIKVKFISGVCLWGADNFLPIPIRWVLIVDPEGNLEPLPLMSTDVNLAPEKIIEFYIGRWNLEVTFEETREHLGIETQRQWSDKAIARTTPILMAFYSLICLAADKAHTEEEPLEVAKAAWYEKDNAAFSDLIRAVRKSLWRDNLIFRNPILSPSFINNNENFKKLMDIFADQLSRVA